MSEKKSKVLMLFVDALNKAYFNFSKDGRERAFNLIPTILGQEGLRKVDEHIRVTAVDMCYLAIMAEMFRLHAAQMIYGRIKQSENSGEPMESLKELLTLVRLMVFSNEGADIEDNNYKEIINELYRDIADKGDDILTSVYKKVAERLYEE